MQLIFVNTDGVMFYLTMIYWMSSEEERDRNDHYELSSAGHTTRVVPDHPGSLQARQLNYPSINKI